MLDKSVYKIFTAELENQGNKFISHKNTHIYVRIENKII